MKHIRTFNSYIKEEVSGTELIGPVGPGYGETGLQNKTVTQHDTTIIISDIDNAFYTIDDYNNKYGDYLKKGGKPLPDGFNKENLEIVIQFLKEN